MSAALFRALAALLLASFSVFQSAALASDTVNVTAIADCASARSIRDYGLVGDQAIITSEGDAFVLQCGDRTIRHWSAAGSHTANLGVATLFGAARQQQILPSALSCPVWPENFTQQPPDCTIADISPDGSMYLVLHGASEPFVMALAATNPLYAFPFAFRAGAFSVTGNELFAVSSDLASRPSISEIDTRSWERRRLFPLPYSDTIMGNREPTPISVALSRSTNLIVVGFNGAFVGTPGTMAFVRAYLIDGTFRWEMRDNISRTEANFSGGFANVFLFGSGRFAAVSTSSDLSISRVLDVASGTVLGTIDGRIIGAATAANRLIVRISDTSLTLVEWTPPQ